MIYLSVLLSLITASVADDKKPDVQALFNILKYQNLTIHDTDRELTGAEIAEGEKRGIFQEIDLQYFKDCGKKCLSKLEELKITPSPGQKFKMEYLYEDFELTKPVAELIGTNPFLIRIKDMLHTIEKMPENYLFIKPYYARDRWSSLMPTTIPFVNPYKSLKYPFLSGGAIWLKELKQFAYYYKKSQFLSPYLQLNNFIKEGKCLYQGITRGFRGKPKLYDEKGGLVPQEFIKKLFVLGYKFEGDSIRFYFASDEKVSNLIDGVTITPNYLVDYFKLHEKYSFLLKKKDLLDENGEIVYFQGSDNSGSLLINCPFKFPKEIEEKLRSKKMKFSDLPKDYLAENYTGNVQFICHEESNICKNEKDDEKWKEYLDGKYK